MRTLYTDVLLSYGKEEGMRVGRVGAAILVRCTVQDVGEYRYRRTRTAARVQATPGHGTLHLTPHSDTHSDPDPPLSFAAVPSIPIQPNNHPAPSHSPKARLYCMASLTSISPSFAIEQYHPPPT